MGTFCARFLSFERVSLLIGLQHFCSRAMLIPEDQLLSDIAFDIFTHATTFFGYKVCFIVHIYNSPHIWLLALYIGCFAGRLFRIQDSKAFSRPLPDFWDPRVHKGHHARLQSPWGRTDWGHRSWRDHWEFDTEPNEYFPDRRKLARSRCWPWRFLWLISSQLPFVRL